MNNKSVKHISWLQKKKVNKFIKNIKDRGGNRWYPNKKKWNIGNGIPDYNYGTGALKKRI